MLKYTIHRLCRHPSRNTLQPLSEQRAPRIFCCCCSVQKAPCALPHAIGMLPLPPAHNRRGNQGPCSEDILGLLWALWGDSCSSKPTHSAWYVGSNVANTFAASIVGGEHKRQPDEPVSCIKCKTCQVSMHLS